MFIQNELEKGDKLDVKRLRLPGIVLKCNCPNCGKNADIDLSQDSLCEPSIDSETVIYFYCPHCEHEWQHSIILSVKVSLPPKPSFLDNLAAGMRVAYEEKKNLICGELEDDDMSDLLWGD